MKLTLFTQPQVLRQVGHKPLAELFGRFTHLSPAPPNPKPDTDTYFESLARVMERPQEFHALLAQVLYDLEATAAAMHHPEAVPQDDPARNPENTAPHRLGQAIEQWLAASKATQDGLASRNEPKTGSPRRRQPKTGSPRRSKAKTGQRFCHKSTNPLIPSIRHRLTFRTPLIHLQRSNPLLHHSTTPSAPVLLQRAGNSLRALPDRPFSSNAKFNEIRLARHLATLGIYPKQFRIGQYRGKGYEFGDLAENCPPPADGEISS